MNWMRVFMMALVFSALGCASSAGGRRGASRDVVTQEQLAATNSTDIYTALEKLRPEWLTTRGPASISDATPAQPSVFMNGQMLGTVDYLRQLRVLDVTTVRYWAAGPASARFGMGHQRGVIELSRQ